MKLAAPPTVLRHHDHKAAIKAALPNGAGLQVSLITKIAAA